MTKNKIIAAILMIIGVSILFGVGLFVLDRASSPEPDGLGTWIFAVLGLVLGASSGIKGWLDWNKKDTPSQVTNITANDDAQVATGEHGRNIRQGDNSQYYENYHEAPRPEKVFSSLHQLPQPPADFTGREELIELLTSDFNFHKGATISGLTGMGGIGKTVLGLKVAHKIADNYPDAQIFLDLKGTTTPLTAVDIARHVILSFEPTADLRALDETNMQSTYQSVLHGKKALLFLDNARSAEQIAPLRPPEICAMLVTSRWTFSVPGLQSRRVDVMEERDAKDFLLELCPRIDNKAAELAKACAYLPLALRIAGSFLQVNSNWSIDKYLRQLNDRKGRLATLKESREDAELVIDPDLRATFELSYSQLSDENRKYWRALGVFPSSFVWNAIALIWGLEEDKTHKLLNTLCRYSLLEHNVTINRYMLHDLLADFALEKLDSAEEEEAQYRFAQCYLNVLNTANTLYARGGTNIVLGLHVFDSEWENINHGFGWAINNSDANTKALSLTNKYPRIGHLILPLRLKRSTYIQWYEHALTAAQEMGDEREVSYHLTNLGNAYSDIGDMSRAINCYEQALDISHKVNDLHNVGLITGNLGIAHAKLGETQKAIGFFERHLDIAHQTGDRRGEGHALGNLGNAYRALGNIHKAIYYHEKDLSLARDIGDRHGEMISLGSLGIVYASLHDYQKAKPLFEQQLMIAQELGDKHSEGMSLGFLGYATTILGHLGKGVEMIRQAISILEEIESPDAQWGRDRLAELRLTL